MKLTFWQRLDLFARHMTPLALTLLLLLLGAVQMQIPLYGQIAPSLALMGVYYWSIHRPDLMGPGTAFVVGLLADLLGGGPLGVNTLIMLLVHGSVAFQRTFFLGKPFVVSWWAFGLVAAVAGLAGWVLVSILYGVLVHPGAMAFNVLLTVGLYPLLAWVFARIHAALLWEA